ncbi:MAG: hypothetical protein WD065_13190 [Planctomycetaceae bacterium]
MNSNSTESNSRRHGSIAVITALAAIILCYRVVHSTKWEPPPSVLRLNVSAYQSDPAKWQQKPSRTELGNMRFVREMYIAHAFVPRSKLVLLPVPPRLEILRMENFHEVCSETCNIYASGQPPYGPEFLWTGSDMEFLRRFPHLRELDLRAVWLGTGVMKTISEIDGLKILSLNRCDLLSEELPELTRLHDLRVLKFYWSYLNRSEKMTDPSWISQLHNLREVHLIGAGDDAVRTMARAVPRGCRVVIQLDQGKRLSDVPNVIARADDELDTPKGY